MDILAELNPEQRQAVEAIGGPVLILAGPGSGKTRVIAHRVAYLITVCKVNPHRIMAVTFTNKAAREMVERLNQLVSGSVADLTLGTFHAICARILRREGRAIGIDPRFVIYDDEDQISLLKRSIQEVDLDPKQYAPRAIQSAISAAKSRLLDPQDYIQHSHSYFEEVVQRVYQRYQQLLADVAGRIDVGCRHAEAVQHGPAANADTDSCHHCKNECLHGLTLSRYAFHLPIYGPDRLLLLPAI